MMKESEVETNLVTLSRHVLNEQKHHSGATGDLTLLLVSIQLGCKFVSSQVRRAGLANLYQSTVSSSRFYYYVLNRTGLAGQVNVQGEDVKKLDVVANNIFVNSLRSSGKVSVMVSEENEQAIFVNDDDGSRGGYCVVFDPLDGSSNIDSGVSIGTIFGVYHTRPGSRGSLEDVLRPGSEMVAAGYAMYGSFTSLVLTTGGPVHGYTLDPNLGEFILTNPNMRIPDRGKTYSVNEGNSRYWEPPCKAYFDSIKFPSDPAKNPYSARYVGSMVADVHRTLLTGGIFAYPADKKSPKGKLRLLYECFPMAMIVEGAGGRATDGKGRRILDIQPEGIHDRSSIVLGSKLDVDDYESFNL